MHARGDSSINTPRAQILFAAHPLIKAVMPQAIVSNRGKSEEDSRQAAPRAVEACGTSAFLSERTWAGDDSRCSWAGGPNEPERHTALL